MFFIGIATHSRRSESKVPQRNRSPLAQDLGLSIMSQGSKAPFTSSHKLARLYPYSPVMNLPHGGWVKSNAAWHLSSAKCTGREVSEISMADALSLCNEDNAPKEKCCASFQAGREFEKQRLFDVDDKLRWTFPFQGLPTSFEIKFSLGWYRFVDAQFVLSLSRVWKKYDIKFLCDKIFRICSWK